MFKKGTKLYSVVNNKCPKCHEGEFFLTKNPYDFSKLGKMHDKCSVCEQSYRIEAGFYFGAAYVSYAFGVAMFVAVWVGANVLSPELSTHIQVFLVVLLSLVLFPVNFWLSRIIWINLFVKFKKD
jgi:uncharacterized protein (DUF983 family)